MGVWWGRWWDIGQIIIIFFGIVKENGTQGHVIESLEKIITGRYGGQNRRGSCGGQSVDGRIVVAIYIKHNIYIRAVEVVGTFFGWRRVAFFFYNYIIWKWKSDFGLFFFFLVFWYYVSEAGTSKKEYFFFLAMNFWIRYRYLRYRYYTL